MTNKQGRVNRKNSPAPLLIEEPPLVVNCICPSCGASITPTQVVGTYLGRRCPACGQPIKPSDFDRLASSVLRERESIHAQEIAVTRKLERLGRWRKRFAFPLLLPLRKFVDRKLARTNVECSSIKEAGHRLDSRLSSLAHMRYYLSEWYFRTAFPLKRVAVAPFQLRPYYDDKGIWHLPRGKKEISGSTAEFAVFQALYDEVTSPNSILHKAQIVPNIYLPRTSEQARNGSVFWDQIDMVVLTRQAAFVIEVKRRFKRIRSDAPFEDIWSKSPARDDGKETARNLKEEGWDITENRALSQNSRHAVAFDDLVPQFPFDRVFEQVVFVGPQSFESNSNEFVGNVNVSCLDGDSRFLLPIMSACSKLSPIATQSAIDELGETLATRYGDLNQKRSIIHANRVKQFREH